jgi:hypothetical protein
MSTHAIVGSSVEGTRGPARRTGARLLAADQGAAWQTAAGLLIAAAAAGLTVFVTKRATLSGAAIVLVVAGSLWFASTRRVGMALALLVLYLGLLDGYLKLATGSSLVTFLRDALLYAIVIGLLLRATVQRKSLPLPPLSAWVIAFVVLVLAQLANPGDGTLYHSLAGIRQHLEFVPLFFLAYAFVRTTKALRMFAILLAVLAVGNGVANVVQFGLTPAQFASWGPGYKDRVLGIAPNGAERSGRGVFYDASGNAHTRPFGLLSDTGGGGMVCALALGAVVGLAWLPGKRRYLLLAAIAGPVAVAGIITSQTRSVVVCGFVVLLGYGLLRANSRRGVLIALGVAVLAAVSYGVIVSGVGSSADSANPASSDVLRSPGLNAGNLLHQTGQSRGRSLSRIPGTLAKYPFGAGLGVSGPATGTGGAPPQAGNVDAENEISFATLETGIPGMLVLIGFTVALFALAARRCRDEPDPEARGLLAAVLAPLAGILCLYVVSAATPTTPAGPYLWAAGGIVAYWLVARPAARRPAASPITTGA